MRKHHVAAISALCIFVIAFSAMCFVACDSIYTNTPQKPQTPKATSFVCIDVNPSIELVLDQNDVVMSASGANKDGKALLFEEDGIVDSEIDVAVSNIASLALKYGYVEDGATVNVEVSSSAEQNLFDRISAKFASALEKSNPQIDVSFVSSCDYVLRAELAKLQAEHPEQSIRALDVSTYRLVKKVMQSGVSLTDAAAMPLESLLAEANELQSDLTSRLDDSYRYAVNRAQYVFDSAKQVAQNSVYTDYYVKKASDAIKTNLLGALPVVEQAIYASKYCLLSASKSALEFYRECAALSEENPTYSFSAGQIDLSPVFGDKVALLEDKFSDGDGFVTVSKDDFDAFANTVYRNADDSLRASFDKSYPAVADKLSAFIVYDAESVSLAKSTLGKIADDISPLFEQIKKAFASVPFFSTTLDSDLSISGCIPSESDLEDASSLDAAIERFADKAAEAFENMQVSQEDEQSVKDILSQSDFVKLIADARAALSDALEQAKTDAANILVSLKNARAEKNRA